MALSNYLAEIWGISLVSVSLALLVKPKHLKRLFAEVENEATMLFCGVVSLVIGISMVLVHNVWVKDWRVAVTVLGWIALVKGLSVLFMPDQTKMCVKKIENKQGLPVAFVVLVFAGLVLTYFGFTA